MLYCRVMGLAAFLGVVTWLALTLFTPSTLELAGASPESPLGLVAASYLRIRAFSLPASLMNTVLGVFGMMGRIGKNVREAQGLAYYAYSSLQGGLGPGAWLAAAGVAPDKAEQAISSILDEIARIQNERVPAEELADSQAYRIGSLPVGLETNSGIANVITDMELYDWGLDYLLEYPNLVRAITPEQVQAAAQKYLSTENLGIAVAGPEMEEIRTISGYQNYWSGPKSKSYNKF